MRIGDVVVGEKYAWSKWKPMRCDRLSEVKVLSTDAKHTDPGHSQVYGGRDHPRTFRACLVCFATGEERTVPARELRMLWSEYTDKRDARERGERQRIKREGELQRQCDDIAALFEEMSIDGECKVWNTPALHIVFHDPAQARLLAQALDTVRKLSTYDRAHLIEHLVATGALPE